MIVMLALSQWSYVEAQETRLFGNSEHKVGFVSGFGDQRWMDVSYDYQVVFFQVQYYWAFHRRKTWGLDLLVQPQYNLTQYRHVDGYTQLTPGYELGVNAGLLIRKNFEQDGLSVYFLASIGPHYISGSPERQVAGFIFSDNILAGASMRIANDFYLDIRSGIRHISNAGLKHPSLGINNLVINAGFFLLL